MNKFWNFVRDEATGERILRLDGAISDSTWFDDEVTPNKFREELNAGDGDISIWINSPGGDCFAASQIYNMLMDYRGHVTVKIDGIAASAASVIAMAGETVEISPTGMIMIHNPSTVAFGDAEEMKAAIKMLDEVKESIINAYELKTSLPREKLSRLMDAETWLSAHKAVELKFADKIMFAENHADATQDTMFSQRAVTNSLLDRIKCKFKKPALDAAKLFKQNNEGRFSWIFGH